MEGVPSAGGFLKDLIPDLREFRRKPCKTPNDQVNKCDRGLSPAPKVHQFFKLRIAQLLVGYGRVVEPDIQPLSRGDFWFVFTEKTMQKNCMEMSLIIQFYANFYSKLAAKDFFEGCSNFTDILALIGGKYYTYRLINCNNPFFQLYRLTFMT